MKSRTKRKIINDDLKIDKSSRGAAAQFFVAGELCRRGMVAVVTLGNSPNTDILCSNSQGTKFAHIQVKTFSPGNKTVMVGPRSEIEYGESFFWVLAGIPVDNASQDFVYYVIPSKVMAANVSESHKKWVSEPGKNGRVHNDSNVRTIALPPFVCNTGWDLRSCRNNWNLITEFLS